jgi:hypothetical protein
METGLIRKTSDAVQKGFPSLRQVLWGRRWTGEHEEAFEKGGHLCFSVCPLILCLFTELVFKRG